MDQNLTTILLRGEEFDLLPERCAFRRSDKTLLASDLHWGKSETFQAHGLAIPSTVIDDDLKRLSQALVRTKAERLLVLGDLIHTPRGVTDGVSTRVEDWRKHHPNVVFEVIRGNHDRRFRWPVGWHIDDVGTRKEDKHFVFTHDGLHEDTDKFVWMGHIHPVVNMVGGGDRLRLPCFVIEENAGLLPAFSAFTGGANIGGRTEGRRVFVIADTNVIEV